MSIFNPLFSAALTVFLPKAAMMVSFCLKSGKFLNNDSIPDGLKKLKCHKKHFSSQKGR